MTVVAGVDESPKSRHVVATAIEQARFQKTDLHLVHVTHTPMVYTEVPIDWVEVLEAQRRQVWAQLEQEISNASDVHIERVDLEGYPPDLLVDYANGESAQLLVVGTRGRGELASLILGSTSHRAIHLATCDVLVVKLTDDLETVEPLG